VLRLACAEHGLEVGVEQAGTSVHPEQQPALVHLATVAPDRRRAHPEGVGEIDDVAGAVLPQMLQQPALSIEAQHGCSVSSERSSPA
jgi:hypothetical protein